MKISTKNVMIAIGAFAASFGIAWAYMEKKERTARIRKNIADQAEEQNVSRMGFVADGFSTLNSKQGGDGGTSTTPPSTPVPRPTGQ